MSTDDATGLMDLGFTVTPLRGKIPTLRAWTTQPKPDAATVRQWAAMGNLGVRTGRISQVVVIDAEMAAEQDAAAKIILVKLPATWTVNTGGGGRHYYYRIPDGATVGNSVGKLAPYIDVRGEGGQVVAPGSVHPGTGAVYEWAEGLAPESLPIAVLPGWVIESANAKPERGEPNATGTPHANGSTHRSPPGSNGYAAAALKGECSAVAAAPVGARNDTLNRAAFKLGTLVGAGELDESDVVASLTAATPLGDREARLTINSGMRAGKTKPRAPRPIKRVAGIVESVRQSIAADPNRSAFTSWHDLGLTLNSNGGPYANLNNAELVLRNHAETRGRFWYDTFHLSIFTNWCGPERELADHDLTRLLSWMQKAVGLNKMMIGCVEGAVEVVARDSPRDEPLDWLRGLKWDGHPRLEDMLAAGWGAEPGEYAKRIGECFMVSMAARILRPGCKVDTMLVFEGGQGSLKTQALTLLGGKWFVECQESLTSKDFYEVMRGKMLLEISELHAFRRAEVERIKGIISCPIDRYRSPYGRRAESHPRRCVFAGTTNQDDWQQDATGGRRFWPVRCGRVNLGWIDANREQMFAESAARVQAGDNWWVIPDRQAHAEQHSRRGQNPWEERVTDVLIGHEEVTLSQVMDGLHILPADYDRLKMSISTAMRNLGWATMRRWNDERTAYLRFWGRRTGQV